ncbi:uncharacterized protein LOC129317536 [Prosopis cineraria]|uniref:uncharacterized protein LOC129317536 n=1 Tax=Prosopis cineraria TaxID=364024 RepID=UPI00240FA1BA|nr:uncharacterized protein LOC129317536 [Prosopis cineraria]
MADSWTDVRQQTLINFLVYSTYGMVFVKSVDALDLVKESRTLFSLFCKVIEWVGPKNIVHVVTNNAANYVACGKKRPGWKEIVRPGATRFATTFIMLHSIYMHKHDLQTLVTDTYFVDHKLSKTQARIIVTAIILGNGFWGDCLEIVKVVSPLIKLLRIVDSDEKPSLPYVYEGMQRAKKRRLLLNPAFLYDENFIHKRRLMDAMLDVFESNESEEIDYIVKMKQLSLYRDRKESFDKTSCQRAAQKLDPYEWWSFYGGSVLELQTLAMRILSQTSSSSSYERNWNDKYMNVLESPPLPNVASGSGFSHSTPNVSMPGDLNEVNDNFGVGEY